MFVGVQDPGKKKINSSLTRGCLQEKIEKFPCRTQWQGVTEKFSLPGPDSSRQNIQVLAKIY